MHFGIQRSWLPGSSRARYLFLVLALTSIPASGLAETTSHEGDFVVGAQYVLIGTREVVTDANVHLIRQKGLLGDPELIASTVTDEEGKFRFEGLQPPSQIRADYLSYRVVCDAENRPISILRYSWTNVDPDTYKIGVFPKQTKIRGRVLDHQGKPAKDAILSMDRSAKLAVALGLHVAVTDAEGNFEIERVRVSQVGQNKPQPITFYVHHDGYPSASASTMADQFAEVHLVKGCKLSGTVVEGKSDRGVAGVIVSAAKTKSRSSEQHTLTDQDGRYELIVSEGNYNVMLEDRDFVAPAIADIECPQGRELELDPLVATIGGWLTGRVIHPRTGDPVVFGNGNTRIRVGVYGPARPDGYDFAAEVNDDGRFRFRAAAGDNYPYLINQQSDRMPWDTRKQPPVKVAEGEMARCFIKIKVDRTDEEKMIDATKAVAGLPKDKKLRTEAIVAEFRKLNHTVDQSELWCAMMQDLIKIGADAVPVLCKELDETTEQRMMRRLGFALRSINDPRAVPALIRAIPKTLQPAMSDYGLIVGDADLLAFMQEHDLDAKRRGRHFSFGRPVREVFGALNKITGKKLGEFDLYHVHLAKDPRTKYAQQQQYQASAQKWRDWWQQHWQEFDVDAAYSKVDLKPLAVVDLSSLPSGLQITKNAEIDRSMGGQTLTAMGDKQGANFFLDLDTGSSPKLPKSIPKADGSADNIQKAIQWADGKRADLFCVSYGDDKKHPYVLRAVGMKLWEIDPLSAKNITIRLTTGELPTGRKIDDGMLLHFDPETKQLAPKIGSSFLFLTREDGLGIITVTDFVTEARDITGMFSTPKGVGFHRGVRFDWKTIVR